MRGVFTAGVNTIVATGAAERSHVRMIEHSAPLGSRVANITGFRDWDMIGIGANGAHAVVAGFAGLVADQAVVDLCRFNKADGVVANITLQRGDDVGR